MFIFTLGENVNHITETTILITYVTVRALNTIALKTFIFLRFIKTPSYFFAL